MHGAPQRVSTLPVPTWPTGSSEMHERIRAYDWAATSLGPLEGWPQSLKTAVELMLDAKQPAHVTWGEDLIYLYNDQVCECLGTRHPAALGRPMTEVFPEIGDYLAWLKTRVTSKRPGRSIRKRSIKPGRQAINPAYRSRWIISAS